MDKLKVLLVDDEAEFISALAERLELRGFRALTAASGEQALRVVDADVPDVVVLDVMMPGVGGIEVLRRIKETHPAIQVILLTGKGSVSEAADGVRLGAFDYLLKPVQIEELIRKMTESTGKVANGPSQKEV
jgi:DNA-binding response OmpR family regulator